MPHYGVFVDPSEYRRNNLDFAGDRLTALVDLVAKDWVTLLQTDVSVLEVHQLIRRNMEEACEALRKSVLAPLKSVDDDRLGIFKSPPTAAELADKLISQYEHHLKSGSYTTLAVSDVDPAVIFDAYFSGAPPFDSKKKRAEFPDAFTLQRLVIWADQNKTPVFVVGPDPDLKTTCDIQVQLQHFEKIEALLDHINRARADALVQRLQTKPQDFTDILLNFVRDEFVDLMFILRFHPPGFVENVSVSDVEIQDVYALEVGDKEVRSEAVVVVAFTADFSYGDLNTGFYDKETGEHFMMEYVNGEIEDTCNVSVCFNFSVDAQGESIVADLSLREDTITVQEEDRGDYGFWK